jgi:hypothetical protein
MTALKLEPSAHAPWTSTIFGRALIWRVPSWPAEVTNWQTVAAGSIHLINMLSLTVIVRTAP